MFLFELKNKLIKILLFVVGVGWFNVHCKVLTAIKEMISLNLSKSF
jgi:hypothetical protein